MIPSTTNSMQGTGDVAGGAAGGKYADAVHARYAVGMKYTSKGTNVQGQVQLVLERGTYGTYYVKSNSITSVAFTNPDSNKVNRDVTLYTKASIYRVEPSGAMTSIDGNVTLRIDAREVCKTDPCAAGSYDLIGFTVLSSKDSSLYYSNNWVLDATTKSWKTVPQPVSTTGSRAVVIN